MKRGVLAVAALVLSTALTMTAAASPVNGDQGGSVTELASGVEYKQVTAQAEGEALELYTVTADGASFDFAIATHGTKSDTIGHLAQADGDGALAVINGDHFSFQTGIPMGMSASEGRLITSPIEAYDADGYFFHVLGIMEDGSVKVGENPMMELRCRVGDAEIKVDRVNRTRETWVGGQVCLYTTDYGDTTGTNAAGIEYILDTGDAVLDPGETITATVKEINRDNDAPIEEGTMVLSVSLLCFEQIKDIKEGDDVELTLTFDDEDWEDVVFAVGGNRAIVEDGQPLPFEYAPGSFNSPNPRSAIGVREDGTLVMAAMDGRSDASRGLTANETAEFMAENMDCAYAILLDGGGSTAMAVADDAGELTTVNVPSDGSERPVGNAVMLIEKASSDTSGGDSWIADNWWVLVLGGVVLVAAIAVITAALLPAKHGKNA